MSAPQAVNWRLASLIDEAGMSNKGLAKRVEVLASQAGSPVPCTHTYVDRWLRGMKPRDRRMGEFVAQALSAALKRTVTAEEADLVPAARKPDARAVHLPQGWRCIRRRAHLALLVPGPAAPVEVA